MNTATTQLQHLGSETQYNVFAAELTAMCLSARIAQDDTYKWDFYTDSQAAIQAVIKPGRQSGQSIIKEFLDHIDTTMDEKPHLSITITWIPGHAEIEGNVRADLEAKKAARNPTSSQLFHHRPLKSARIRCIKANAKQQWAEHGKNAKRAHNSGAC
jgi:ribonuclease HI